MKKKDVRRRGRGRDGSSRRRQSVPAGAGRRMIDALTELAESVERGEAVPPGAVARHVEVPDEPGAHDAAAIRAARQHLGASREAFAGMLGVSPALVQSLELGRREPSGRVRRMLDEFAREPDRWRRGLADAGAVRAKAEALAALEDLRARIAALAGHKNDRAIDVRLDELRDAIGGIGVRG